MTEYPYFSIHPGYNEETGDIGYVIFIHHSISSMHMLSGFYDNTFLAKQQIDRWEYDRKETEKHMNLPAINYNPRYLQ